MLPFLLALTAGLPAAPASSAPAANQPGAIVTTVSGLRLQILAPGPGPKPSASDSVLLSYEGRLADGSIFDRTRAPSTLPLAALVPGFTEALLLMNKGGRYRIWIPPHLAYGAEGAGGVIPANAEIQFTIDLHDIVPSEPQPQ